MNKLAVVGIVVSAALVAACGGKTGQSAGSPAAPAPAASAPAPAVAALQLREAPAGAIGVNDAKAKGPAASVAVTGRIASIVRGYAAMTLMDLSLPYCGEVNKEDKCKTPWDWCCDSAATRTANSMVVEARDAAGKPLATPSLGDLRLLDQVTVTGELVKDEHGNFTLLATGWHRTARPTLPDYVQWPQ